MLKLLNLLDWLDYFDLIRLLLIYQMLLSYNKFLKIWFCLLSIVSCSDMGESTSWETFETCELSLVVYMLMDYLWIY